ncbi:unnamed protein product [Symbiodinium necroappetens]|uniref:Uncharacterized protein n=1 Tax=Symbiodinium necroappetens TaxID=1628268 RepID=A0A812SSV1_9DINO|nr:unnamed protein product [Symbiodinium necroappetens]
MAPKGREPSHKGKGKQSNPDEATKDMLNFGYPQPVVSALQAIATRSTAGLFRDPVAVAADQSVQQLAQSQANALDKLGKRINGNLRAKHSLQEAATAWLGKIGQHLAALTSRLSTVATRLDQDQAEAITALQQASVNLEASAQEQVDKALGGMGPIWSQVQEAEVMRLAACLRAFSAVGGGEAAITGVSSTGDAGGPGMSSFAAPGSAMTRSPLGEADGPTLSTPARSSTSGEAMDVSNPDLSAKRRWNQRGNRHPRPSKSPRRELDLSAEPWPRVATGLTPDRPRRPRTSAEEEELIPAVATPPYTWASAWYHISRHCWELGAEYVGHVATSDPQEQVLPVLHLTADPEQVVTEGERLWGALQQSIQQLESDADTGRFVEQLTLWLETVRERPLALPSVRQGLLTLAHAVSGNIYSVDGFGPSTAQEWLFPAELLAQEIPLVGLLPTTWDSMALRVLVTMPCPMRRVPEDFGCAQAFIVSSTSSVQPLQLSAISLAPVASSLFSGTIPAAQSEADLSEVVEEPPLVPCPLTMLADERLHGRALHRRILLNLGVEGAFAWFEENVLIRAGSCLQPLWTRRVGSGLCMEFWGGATLVRHIFGASLYVSVPYGQWWHYALVVPCVLDFRPTGWRIAAVDDGLDLPSEWPMTCRSGGFGILHKETAVETGPFEGYPPQATSPYDVVADASFGDRLVEAGDIPDVSFARPEFPGSLFRCAVLGAGSSSRFVSLACLVQSACAMLTQSEPPSPRFVIESPKPALDSARLAPPSAHQRLQTHWQQSALDVGGALSRMFLSFWGYSRPVKSVMKSCVSPALQVHLVMAATTPAMVTVIFDAGFEVWCADVPRHASASHLIATACDLAATDALQLNTEITLPLRHGDVLPVRLDANRLQVDLSRNVLARASTSATVWLDPVQSFYILTSSRGLQGFQVGAGSDVRPSLLRTLLTPEEGPGGTFLELPSRSSLPFRIFVHCRKRQDHVVFRVSEASDPSDSGFFFLFSGTFDTYADFARRLGQLQTPEARWIKALRPYGLTVNTWESMALTRAEGASFWYVQLHADVMRAQLHYTSVQVSEASFRQVAAPPAPRRPVPVTTRATQTLAGPGGFPHEIAIWQTSQQPTHCEPSLFPEISSTLADVWCDAWHIKCLIPCIPEFQAWVLRDGSRLIGLCTVDINWDLVSQALHISTWELPQTFVHGDGLLIPYPEPLHHAKDRCLSVSHDTPEAVACLSGRRDPPPEPGLATRPFGNLGWMLGSLCLGGWRVCLTLCTFLVLPKTLSVRLDEVLADAADDPIPEPLPFRDYLDLTRTCTMSWTHELSRQALGFSVRAQILGEHIQRIAPAPEVLLHLWRPGRGPTLLQVRPRCLALHLGSFLRALGYSEGVDSLHIAYDTGPHALDLVLVPPTGGTWWILQDHSGREVLRPVARHYTSAIHFRLLTVSPDRHAQTVCPAYGVQQQPLLPQGARGRVVRDLPELHGSLCQGILGFAMAAGARRSHGSLFGLIAFLVHSFGVAAVVSPDESNTLGAGLAVIPSPQPHTLRVWTVGVKRPVDLPWKPEGYNTRWLHDFICSIHGVREVGHFLSTTGAAGDSVMHLLFVPRLNNPAGGQPRFWLFHVEDRASVVYGHYPFDWGIASTHVQDIYQGLNVPSSRPTLVIGSRLVAPSCHLLDVPSGSIVQIPIGALPMEASDDAWDPTPWVVPGPFFQYVPARGPAGEDAISPAQASIQEQVPTPPLSCEVACQTDMPLAVDTPLLSAQGVSDLAMQLHGLADCLTSLPIFAVEAPPAGPQSPCSSHNTAPVFCGPPADSVDATEGAPARAASPAGETSASVELDTSGARHGPSRPYLCFLASFLLTVRPRAPPLVRLVWLAASLDGAFGSYFTPNASGSEDEEAHSVDIPEGHRPGDGAAYPSRGGY